MKYLYVPIQIALYAGTAMLFFAMSLTILDGLPTSIVFYSLPNFLMCLMPTAVSSYYLHLARNSRLILVTYGVAIACWVALIIVEYANDGFECEYWSQGDISCETFDGMLLFLVAINYVMALIGAIFYLNTTRTQQNIYKLHLIFAIILAILLAFDFFIVVIPS